MITVSDASSIQVKGFDTCNLHSLPNQEIGSDLDKGFPGCFQEVQKIVIPAIEKYSTSGAHEGSSQLARAQANAATAHLEALLNGHDDDEPLTPTFGGASVPMEIH